MTCLEKNFKSSFDSSIEIDEANYVTEFLIRNRLIKYGQPIPNSPFWRKSIAGKSEKLTGLAETYVMELTEIKNLLYVFDSSILVHTIQSMNLWTLRYLKKEQKADLSYTLVGLQIKKAKEIKKVAKATKVEYQPDFNFTNKESKFNLL